MKEKIDLLTSLAIYARDYAKKKGIEPVDKYIDFGDSLAAYSVDDYSFFSFNYDHETKVVVHTYQGHDKASITLNPYATDEELQAIYDKAFNIVFNYEKNNAEILEKQKLARIIELESKLAKLRDL